MVINLPSYDAKVRLYDGQQQIFDPVRQKYVALTPEEWVRQHFINYLTTEKKYPTGLISVEMLVEINGMQQRADIVVYGRNSQPAMIVECKAPSVKLTNKAYSQAARYNLALRAQILVVTNGISHFCSRIDLEHKSFTPLSDIPFYSEIEHI